MRKLAVFFLTVIIALTGCGGSNLAQGSSPVNESAAASADTVVPAAVSDASQEADGGPSAQTTPSAPSSAAAQSTQTAQNISAAQAEPLPWWRAGLAREQFLSNKEYYDYSSGSDFYVYDDVHKVSYSAWGCFSTMVEGAQDRGYDLSLILNSAQESADIGARILPDNFFELVALDDTKYTGEFYEKGIKLTRSLPGEGKGDSVLLALDKNDYATLKANLENQMADGYCDVAWLSMMRRSRMVSATITSSDGKVTNALDFTSDASDDDSTALLKAYFYEDINPRVYIDSQGVAETSLPGAAKVEITFNNGLVFRIYYTKDYVLVNASDVQGSLLYRLKSDYAVDGINNYANKIVNIRTGKPVIYLYPTQQTDCTVTVGYPRFTYTYPKYDNGWRVTAYPDGRLVNKADGSEHYYLFWEGSERINWDFSSGFAVKGTDTEKFLREKLAFMGLTPREYNDFITYWVPQMQNVDYNLITFAGAQYEALAPLTVTPAPDSVLRVHMVFKAIDAPVEIPEQTLTPFVRRGFTVVEWGATNAG